MRVTPPAPNSHEEALLCQVRRGGQRPARRLHRLCPHRLGHGRGHPTPAKPGSSPEFDLGIVLHSNPVTADLVITFTFAGQSGMGMNQHGWPNLPMPYNAPWRPGRPTIRSNAPCWKKDQAECLRWSRNTTPARRAIWSSATGRAQWPTWRSALRSWPRTGQHPTAGRTPTTTSLPKPPHEDATLPDSCLRLTACANWCKRWGQIDVEVMKEIICRPPGRPGRHCRHGPRGPIPSPLLPSAKGFHVRRGHGCTGTRTEA